MLRPGWQGSFHRILDHGSRKERRLEFKAGVPVELKGSELQAVADDIDKALVHVRLDEKGRAKIVEPEEVVVATAKQHQPKTTEPDRTSAPVAGTTSE
jgi:hypothetical protein